MYVCSATFGSTKKTDLNPNEGTPPTGNPVRSKISHGFASRGRVIFKALFLCSFFIVFPGLKWLLSH
jgi:hypothetical protein